MAPSVTLNLSAKGRHSSPSLSRLAMYRTSASESLACGNFSPFAHLSRDAISSIFSWCVPTLRWAVLMQGGLSQLWSTNIPWGTGPRSSSHATLWARLVTPFTRIIPYPQGCRADVQTRHPFGPSSDRARKRHVVEHHFSRGARGVNLPQQTAHGMAEKAAPDFPVMPNNTRLETYDARADL